MYGHCLDDEGKLHRKVDQACVPLTYLMPQQRSFPDLFILVIPKRHYFLLNLKNTGLQFGQSSHL